jgi:hypothetical protein
MVSCLSVMVRDLYIFWPVPCPAKADLRTVWAPVVEVADILGQGFLEIALIEDEHVVQGLCPDRSHLMQQRGGRLSGIGGEARSHAQQWRWPEAI